MRSQTVDGRVPAGPQERVPSGARPDPEGVLRHLRGRQRLLVLTHTNPDPDSLASALALAHLVREVHGLDSTFAMNGRIMRAENQAMVEQLGIEATSLEELDLPTYDAVAVVDSQPGFGHTVIPEGRGVDIVIDHHESDRELGPVSTAVQDVRTDIGATSTILTHYLMIAGVEWNTDVATALVYGIRTDTAELSRNVSPWDQQAYEALLPHIDRRKLAAITRPKLPSEYFKVLREALNNVRIFDHVTICSLGRTHSPEMVAEVADLLLRRKGTEAVFVGGLVDNVYYVSVRTEIGTYDAWPLLRDALANEGSFGGHGSVAGGSVVLRDAGERTMKRLERRLERNILRLMGVESVTVHGLG